MTSPRRNGSSRYGATSSPTSVMRSRPRSARCSCSPRRRWTPTTIPRPCSGSSAGCNTRRSGCRGWFRSCSTSPGCRAASRFRDRPRCRSTRCSTRRWTAPGWSPRPAGSPSFAVATAGLVVLGEEGQLVTAVANLLYNAVAYSPDCDARRARRPAARRRRRDHGHRSRRRHPRGGAGADLRALLPGRPGALASDRRHRPRPGDRQAHGRQPRRRGDSVEPAGQWQHVHHPTGLRIADHEVPWTRRVAGGTNPLTRILVVEDEESFSDALGYMLRREGFEVAMAATGPDGHRRSSTAPAPISCCST